MSSTESTISFEHYRNIRGFTLDFMGRRMGIFPSNVHYKEVGKQGWTLPQIVTYVQTLCVPIDLLIDIPFTRIDNPEELPRPPQDKRIYIPCCYTKGG